MSILLDGLMILLLGLSMVAGWRRGFLKVLGGLLALAAATVATALLGEPLTLLVVSKTTVDPAMVQLLCSAGLFAVVYTLTALLLRWLDFIAKIPIIKQLNTLLGLVVGILSGVLWVLVAVCVLQMLVHLEWLPFLTQSVLDETTLISWVISQLPTVRFVNPVVITR